MFRVGDNGVLYFTVGYVDTDEGRGWFDQAVIYCPFWISAPVPRRHCSEAYAAWHAQRARGKCLVRW